MFIEKPTHVESEVLSSTSFLEHKGLCISGTSWSSTAGKYSFCCTPEGAHYWLSCEQLPKPEEYQHIPANTESSQFPEPIRWSDLKSVHIPGPTRSSSSVIDCMRFAQITSRKGNYSRCCSVQKEEGHWKRVDHEKERLNKLIQSVYLLRTERIAMKEISAALQKRARALLSESFQCRMCMKNWLSIKVKAILEDHLDGWLEQSHSLMFEKGVFATYSYRNFGKKSYPCLDDVWNSTKKYFGPFYYFLPD